MGAVLAISMIRSTSARSTATSLNRRTARRRRVQELLLLLLRMALLAVLSVALGWLADTIGIREALIVVNLFLFMPLIFFWLAFRRDSTKIPVPNTAYVEAD